MNRATKRVGKIIRYATMFIASVILCLPNNPNASAANDLKDMDYFSHNNIKFYNPEECSGKSGGGSTVGGEAVISGSTAEEKVWSGLKSLGITDEVAAGIMGNMIHEGNALNPAQYEGSYYDEWESGFDWETDSASGHGVGLIQWSGGRRVNIMKYIKEHNSNVYEKYMLHPKKYSYANGNVYGVNGDKFIELADSEAEADALYSLQITFLVNEELKVTPEYNGVFNETTVQGAADFFLDNVEQPACPECSRSVRRSSAQEMFTKYSGKERFAGGTGGNNNGASTATTSADDTGSNVTWIGDSISEGAADYGIIKDKWPQADATTGSSGTILSSKQFAGSSSSNPTGQQLVEKLESEGKMRDVLVFALGTNDHGLTEDQIKKMLSAAKTPKTIVLTTNYNANNKDEFKANNEKINNAKTYDSRVVVADWYAAADGQNYFGNDGIHPNKEGSEVFVQTIIDAASTGFSSGNSGGENCECDESSKTGVWAGQKYDLTDSQLRGIMAMIKNENGGSLEMIQTEATLMANVYEFYKPEPHTADGLVSYLRTPPGSGGWFATYDEYNESFSDYTQEEFNAIKDIFNNGNRTMPPEIVEHDCVKCRAGIDYAYNDGVSFDPTDYSKYVSGKTILKQGSGGLSGQYVFYKFADDAQKKGDPFGYFEDNPPGQTSGSTSTTAGSSVSWEDGWISGGLDGYHKDDATTWGYHLDDAANKTFATGGKANKILLHSTEGYGSSGDSVKSLYQPTTSSAVSTPSSFAPHFTADMKNRKIFQHYPLTKTSGAIKSHDDIAGIQIEIMGFTGDTTSGGEWNLRNEGNFSDEDWDYLAKLIIAISEETGAELTGNLDWSGTGARMSVDEMKSYGAVMGHMHAPDNDHYDPVDIWKFLEPAIKRGGGGSGKCSKNTNGDLNATALLLAWPEKGVHGPDDPTEEYRKALREPDGVGTRGEGDECSIVGKSCDAFVVTVLRYSGVDKDVPCCGAANVRDYLASHPEKYTEVTNSESTLQGGDIRASSGHVEMVVEVNGEKKIASASHCNRTGEVGNFYENSGTFRAFRYSGGKAAAGKVAK